MEIGRIVIHLFIYVIKFFVSRCDKERGLASLTRSSMLLFFSFLSAMEEVGLGARAGYQRETTAVSTISLNYLLDFRVAVLLALKTSCSLLP